VDYICESRGNHEECRPRDNTREKRIKVCVCVCVYVCVCLINSVIYNGTVVRLVTMKMREKSEQIGKEPIGGTTSENLWVVIRGSHNDVMVGMKWWD
jgi:hypothetical protein